MTRRYGQAPPLRIVHMTEFLDEVITSDQIRVRPIGHNGTLHAPCQIVRRGALEHTARRVLAALGVQLIEMQDHGLTGYCCWSGGGVSNARASPLRR